MKEKEFMCCLCLVQSTSINLNDELVSWIFSQGFIL
jgi:hypothetical protein